MRDWKDHSIDGFNYRIQQLGAKQGRIVLARVLRVVAGAAEAEDSVSKLASALTDAEVEFLCDTFGKVTQVNAVATPDRVLVLADVFDDHFAGRYGAMVKWLWASLETNYASFLSDMGLKKEALTEAAKNAMSSIQPSPIVRSGGSSSPASGG